MPDEKNIEIINKTTRERPARRWLFWSLIMVGVLFVLAMVPVGGEIWRKQRIIEARRDYADAIQPVRARFAKVNDWPAWYRARLEGTEGCAEFQAWASRWGTFEGPGGTFYDNLEEEIEQHLNARRALDPKDPMVEALTTALIATQDSHNQAKALLRFDNLAGVPAMDNGAAQSDFLTPILAVRAIYRRGLMSHCLGHHDAAVGELQLLLDLHRRMARPEHLGMYVATSALLNVICRLAETLIPAGPLPASVHEELARAGNRDPDFWRRMAEGELAYLAQIHSHFDESGMISDPEGMSWFEWVDASKNPGHNFDEFRTAGQQTKAWAAYVRHLQAWADVAAWTPTSIPRDMDLAGSWPRMFERESMNQLWLQRAVAASELRRLEAEGQPLHTTALQGSRYPDILAAWRDGLMWVQYRPGEKRRLLTSATDDEFDNEVPPLILKPMP